MKTSRHEFLVANGADRHYGQSVTEEFSESNYYEMQSSMRFYLDALGERYASARVREPDLYALFLERSAQLVAHGGSLRVVLPAGLIRSQGTEHLRRAILDRFTSVEVAVMQNEARYFDIDSRFKFVLLRCDGNGNGPADQIQLQVHRKLDLRPERVEIQRGALQELRPDLTIPEVRNKSEWALFRQLSRTGRPMSDSRCTWRPEYQREVDMTRHRPSFRPEAGKTRFAIIEGRMLHQFTSTAKLYVSGEGRRAVWGHNPWLGPKELRPQFYIEECDVPSAALRRIGQERVGFADVTGQTNERTLLAGPVKAGVVCGNKVPTILFENGDPTLAQAWIAVANSFVVDWLLRRNVTTSVNYFVLDSIPFPRIGDTDLRRLASMEQVVVALQHDAADKQRWKRYAQVRAKIDATVAKLWGLTETQMQTILADFKRGSSAETYSFVEDLVLEHMSPGRDGNRVARIREGWRNGREAYVPAEFRTAAYAAA